MYSDPIFSENKDNYLDNSCLLFLPEPYPNFYEYDECIDPKMNLNYSIFDIDLKENENINPTTFLSKKTKRKLIFDIKKAKPFKNENKIYFPKNFNDNDIFKKEENESNKCGIKKKNERIIELEKKETISINNCKVNDYNNNKTKSKCGRKSIVKKLMGEQGKHTKKDEDNIIYKIKTIFGKSLYNYLNSILKGEKFLKLNANINKKLKKDYNLSLFNKKIKDIYFYTDISEKYTNKNKSVNKKIIKDIYSKKIEIEAIQILNLTYFEAFKIFIRKINPSKELSSDLIKKIQGSNILKSEIFDITSIIRNIEENGKQNGEKIEDIEEYINNIKDLCINFKQWFKSKIGRIRYN